MTTRFRIRPTLIKHRLEANTASKATSTMSTPQERLARLRSSAAQPSASENDASLPYWEQEIINHRREQEANAEEYRRRHNPSQPVKSAKTSHHTTIKTNVSVSSRAQTSDHVPGTDPSQVLFLPKGVFSGGLSATNLEEQQVEMPDPEPASSSQDLVGRYCVWSVLTKFPYKYMQDPNGAVSAKFFAGGQIFARNWEMHYIFGHEPFSKPLMLVPYDQVQKLMDEISAFTGIKVAIPCYPFQMSFFNDGCPQPQFLGVSNSREEISALTDGHSQIETPAGYGIAPPGASIQQLEDFEAWQEKVDYGLNVGKKSKSRARLQKDSAMKIQHQGQLERAQRFLGLRQKTSNVQVVCKDETSQYLVDDLIDSSKKAPFEFEENIVFVCVDVEAWEVSHNIITEIGVSTLDTSDLIDIPPGNQGEEWIKKMRSRHIRINGTEDKGNFKFVSGAPDKFRFGQSEWYSKEDAANVVDGCFEHPFSKGFECAGPINSVSGSSPNTSSVSSQVPKDKNSLDEAPTRNVILLGHSVSGDVDYLRSLGSSIFGDGPSGADKEEVMVKKRRVIPTIRETLDTNTIYKAIHHVRDVKSLSGICQEYDIDALFTHNAGNDARYTMEAFVKMIVKSRHPGEVKTIQTDLQPADKSDAFAVREPVSVDTIAQDFRSRSSIAPMSADEDDDDEPPY